MGIAGTIKKQRKEQGNEIVSIAVEELNWRMMLQALFQLTECWCFAQKRKSIGSRMRAN
jgi:hypothetical protein